MLWVSEGYEVISMKINNMNQMKTFWRIQERFLENLKLKSYKSISAAGVLVKHFVTGLLHNTDVELEH